MPRTFDLLIAAPLIVGHFAWCVWCYNRLHASNLPRRLVYVFDRSGTLVTLLLFALYAWKWRSTGTLLSGMPAGEGIGGVLQLHLVACLFAVFAAVPLWLLPRLTFRQSPALASNHTRAIDLGQLLPQKPIHGFKSRLFAALPGNQILQPHIHVKELHLANWPRELDGLSIVHLSDLHLTGELTRPFYDAIFTEAAMLNGDLVVVTGDILENTACLPWIAETFGRLRGKYGQFFIVGNHELRLPSVTPLRQAVVAAGWTDVGGRGLELTLHGKRIYLAGNERPWFGSEPPQPAADAKFDVRILLAHTPDLFPWAQQRGYDLMLAGHTHGGQIRLPFIGPLIAPSVYGFKYASGLFEEGPTVMHVSRGLSGDRLLRFNCPPEVTKLIIRRATSCAS